MNLLSDKPYSSQSDLTSIETAQGSSKLKNPTSLSEKWGQSATFTISLPAKG
jgi:hypothetical protein